MILLLLYRRYISLYIKNNHFNQIKWCSMSTLCTCIHSMIFSAGQVRGALLLEDHHLLVVDSQILSLFMHSTGHPDKDGPAARGLSSSGNRTLKHPAFLMHRTRTKLKIQLKTNLTISTNQCVLIHFITTDLMIQ